MSLTALCPQVIYLEDDDVVHFGDGRLAIYSRDKETQQLVVQNKVRYIRATSTLFKYFVRFMLPPLLYAIRSACALPRPCTTRTLGKGIEGVMKIRTLAWVSHSATGIPPYAGTFLLGGGLHPPPTDVVVGAFLRVFHLKAE